MCMDIGKKELLRINHGFGGNVRSSSSLDFALEMFANRKFGEFKRLAYLWRAILVDHPFSNGNKRTAVFLAFALADELSKDVDRELLVYHAISVAKGNVTDIRKIERRLQNAIK